MKKYLSFLLGATLVFVLIFSLFSLKTAQAYPPVSGGPGDASKIGKINCVYKSSSQFAPNFYNVKFIIGTDKYFFLENGANPTAYPYSTADLPNELHPIAKYTGGSLTNMISFYYQTPEGGDNITADARNLNLNPLIMITDQTKIKTVDGVGDKFYPFDWTGLNDPNMPVCTGSPKSVTIPNPTCSDGIKNQDETGVDVGGVCGVGIGGAGCHDGIKNQDEVEIDKGGICGGSATSGNCDDDIQNGNETGVDVGGSCEGGLTSPGNSNLPTIHHVGPAGRPVEVNWQDINLPDFFNSHLEQSKKDWNLVRSLRISLGGAGATVPMYYDSYPEDWIGAASYFNVGPHQRNPEVQFNKRMMDSLGLNGPAYVQFLVCHELGHAIGAGHVDENNTNVNKGSCMDYSRQPGGGGSYGTMDNLHPSVKDIATLEQLYYHQD